MKYSLVFSHIGTRSFLVNRRTIIERYAVWHMFVDGEFYANIHLTSSSYLHELLKELSDKDGAISFDEDEWKLIKYCLDHTRKWKIFAEARDTLRKQGREAMFNYLKEKLAVHILSDNLKGVRWQRN